MSRHIAMGDDDTDVYAGRLIRELRELLGTPHHWSQENRRALLRLASEIEERLAEWWPTHYGDLR